MSKTDIRLDIINETLDNHKETIDAVNANTETIAGHIKANDSLTRAAVNNVQNEGGLSLTSLEHRIDKLEDYSRRNNLIFLWFCRGQWGGLRCEGQRPYN